MNALLPAETRSRLAISATALLAMPVLFAAVEAEVEQTLEEHPELPRTPRTRCVLWGLALPKLSQAAESAAAETANPKSKTA